MGKHLSLPPAWLTAGVLGLLVLLLLYVFLADAVLRQAQRGTLNEAEAVVTTAAQHLADHLTGDPPGASSPPAAFCPLWDGLPLIVLAADGRQLCPTPGADLPFEALPRTVLNVARSGSLGRFADQEAAGMVAVAVPIPAQRVAENGTQRVGATGPDSAGIVGVTRRPEAPTVLLSALRVSLGLGALVWLLLLALTVLRGGRALREGVGRLHLGLAALGSANYRALPPLGHPELDSLAAALNRRAEALRDHDSELLGRIDEREAVLASMIEAVLAVDAKGRLLWLNGAAEEMFETETFHSRGPALRGTPLIQVVRNAELERFARQAMTADQPLERELRLLSHGRLLLQAHGSRLRTPSGGPDGALLVLLDVTRLRRLEGLRRDFVANVSHELKTPVTTIKGFVETLLDGALDEPQQARHFLEIIARHSERLQAIIEDLLALSRIEQEDEQGGLKTALSPIMPLLKAARDSALLQAPERHEELTLLCPDALQWPVNAALLEQAVSNLISNALKYSPAGTAVRVSARVDAGRLEVSVTDEGPGIHALHLPRLFERFYRISADRSRDAGGTGLGLSIVKHIARAHKGEASVDTALGRGSTFRIVLPLPAAAAASRPAAAV